MATIKRTTAEIDEQLDKAYDGINTGSKYPGMSYEEGITEFWHWLTEDEPDYAPMDD
jgi:hypothetical protein